MNVWRFARGVAVGSLVAWAVRLYLHSRPRPPEGRWRELTLEDLS